MTRLLVAAGGGGDALAAAILHRATSPDDTAVVATFAWDRLLVDPVPGPRRHSDFHGLQAVGGSNYAIVETTRAVPPSDSTLPRLAGDLAERLVLLDPTEGTQGLMAQLRELCEVLNVNQVTVVDVGGDALARGDEPRLRSPLCDGLVLGACAGLDVPVTVLVAGPGLDGELQEADVLALTGPTPSFALAPHHVAQVRAILDWHPSEATALLAAATVGLRGITEIRGDGLAVELTDRSSGVFAVPLTAVLATNRLAANLVGSVSLDQAEAIARSVVGFSEIDYERSKAAHIGSRRPEPPSTEHLRSVEDFEHAAVSRGVRYVTFRRLAEAAAPQVRLDVDYLRRELVATRPERLHWPLWSVAPAA